MSKKSSRGLNFVIRNVLTQQDINELQHKRSRTLLDLSLKDLVSLNKELIVKNLLEGAESLNWKPYITRRMYKHLVDYACFNKNISIEFIEWLYTFTKRTSPSSFAMTFAARSGRIDVLEWLKAHGIKNNLIEAMNSAAMNGHIETLDWLKNPINNPLRNTFTQIAIHLAARNGHIETLKWLYNTKYKRIRIEYEYPMYYATMGGHINVIEWLFENGDQLQPELISHAVSYGQLETVEWLYTKQGLQQLPSKLMNMDFTIHHVNIKIFEWLQAHGASITSKTIINAERNGDIELLEWLEKHKPDELSWNSQNDMDMDMDIIIHALKEGNIKTVEWLIEHGFNRIFRITQDTLTTIAKNGLLDVLKWIKNNLEDIEFDSNMLEKSIENGWYKQTEYLYDEIGLRLSESQLTKSLRVAEEQTYFRILQLMNSKNEI